MQYVSRRPNVTQAYAVEMKMVFVHSPDREESAAARMKKIAVEPAMNARFCVLSEATIGKIAERATASRFAVIIRHRFSG
jgi:hypothetical protein